MLTRRLKQPHLIIAALALYRCAPAASAQTTALTDQGKLSAGRSSANGGYDMQFKLFDALTDGVQQGTTITDPAVAVSAGLFTVTLDFGANVFDGSPRYLEIGVRPAGNANPYTVLAPRQLFTSIALESNVLSPGLWGYMRNLPANYRIHVEKPFSQIMPVH
jgi:hypothetical protein